MIKVPELLAPIDQQANPPSRPTPLADAARSFSDRGRDDFLNTVKLVKPIAPDAYARATEVERYSGVPAKTLYDQRERMEEILQGNRYAGIYDNFRKTANALRDGNLAAISQDDIDQLTRIEGAASDSRFNAQSFGEKFVGAIKQSWTQISQATNVADTADLVELSKRFDAADAEIANAEAQGVTPYRDGSLPGGFVGQYVLATPEERQAMRDNLASQQSDLLSGVRTKEQTLRAMPVDPGARRIQELEALGESGFDATLATLVEQPGFAFRTSAGAVATSAPLLAGGVVGGIPLAAGLGFATERDAKLADILRETGVDFSNPRALLEALQDDDLLNEAQRKARLKAAGTTAVDVLSMGLASRLLVPTKLGGKTLTRPQRELANLAVQFPVQGIGEGAGEAAGQLLAEGEVDAGEVLLETVAGSVGSTLDVLTFGGGRILDGLQSGLKQVRSAKAGQVALDEMADAAVQSKTRGRDVESFRRISEQQLQGSPMEMLWLPAEALQRLNQSGAVDLPAILEQVPGLSEQFAEAVARNGSVSLKTSDYLAYFADYQAELGNSVRVSVDGLSPDDVQTWTDSQEEQLNELAAQLGGQVDPQAAALRDVTGELISAGFRRADAEQYAAVHLSVLNNLADRTGQALDQLRQQFPLDIRAQAPEQLRSISVDDARLAVQRLRGGDIPESSDIFGKSLGEYLRDAGGLDDTGGELAALDVDVGRVGKQRLTRKSGGLSLDQAAMQAWERGYFPGVAREQVGPQLIVDAIQAELAGQPRYSVEQENATLRDQAESLRQLGDFFGRLGVDLNALSDDEALAILRNPEQLEGRVQEQFAGPTAWSADVPALDEAKARIAQGDSPNAVRQATGWFEGVDGKWRFEIDDSAATFKPLSDWLDAAEDGDGVPLGEVLEHPALFAAYPELARVMVRVDPERHAGGFFSGEAGRGFVGAFIELGDPSTYSDAHPAIDTLMHEVQHAIQAREGFATGGSPEVLRAEKDQAMADRDYWQAVVTLRRDAERNGGDYQQAAADYTEVFEEQVSDQQVEDAQRADSVEQLEQRVASAEAVMRTVGNPSQTYTRLAGEIEARNTERRRTLTAEERQAASPEQTADVPGEQAIVWWNGVEMVSLPVDAQADAQVRTLNQSDLERALSMTEDDYIAAVNPTGKTSDESDIVTVHIGDLERPRGAKKVASFNDRDGNPVEVYADSNGSYYAEQDGEVVGQIENRDGETLNIVAVEVQGKGIGTGLAVELIRRDPFAQAGSFSPAGEATRRAAFRKLKAERQQRLEQAADGGQDDSARGFITFTPRGQGDRRFQITLGDKRDLSTVLHEFGHYYLEVIDDLATQANAPEQIKSDVTLIRDWLGAEAGAALTSEQHEQFARGFEHYLAEGKAPSPELAGAFARFKRWLIAIYKDLRRLNVELTDDVRRVFDRLVASDAQIQAAEQVVGAIALFKDAQAAGMTDAEFAAYQDSLELAHADARDAVEEQIVREEERRRSREWRELEAKVRQEVDEELDTLPEYAALTALRKGVLPDGSTINVKLSSSELAERYGVAAVRKLAFTHARNGQPLDLVASLLGYDSGDALVKALLGVQPRGAMRQQEVARRMEERYGPKSTGEAAERALDAVHNERRADVLQKELRRLAEVGNRRNVTSQQILKEAARRVMSERRVRDIQPFEYQRAEAKAGRAAFEAFVKGDLEAAYQAKQQQLLNFYLYKEAVKAREAIDTMVSRLGKYNSKAARQRLGKAGHDYLDQVDAVMEQYEFRNVSLRQLDRAKSFAAWYAEQVAAGQDPYVPEFVLQRQGRTNYKDLSFNQLQELDEFVANINHLASTKNKLLKNARIKDLHEGRALLSASAFANVDQLPRRQLVENARSVPEVMRDWLKRGNSSLLKMEQAIEWLDGGDPNGAWSSLIFQPLAEAQHEADDLNRQYTAKIVAAHEAWIAARGGDIGQRFHLRTINQTMTTSGMLATALNVGNASNRKKLLDGHKWDEATLSEILEHMTQADWNYVQDLWEIVEGLWPQIEALEKRVNGVAPPKVEGLQFTTKDGQFVRGGYWPLVYDPLSTRYADVLSNLGGLAPLGEGGTVRATPARGHTQARVDAFAAPILLDASVIAQHLNQVILDLTHREALHDVRRLYTGEVREAVTQTLGPDLAAQFVNLFDGIATGQSSGNLKAISTFAKTMNALRSNQSLAWMGYSITTVLNQISGYPQALDYFAQKGGRKYLYRAFLKFWADPRGQLATIREVSGEMRNRAINLDVSIREAQSQVLRMKDGRFVQDTFKGMANGRDVMVKYAFVPMQAMQSVVDGVVWMAGYEQAGGVNNHDEAVQAGDRAVRLTQTAGGAKDLASIQQNVLAKLFMPVYGYASLLWNRNVDIARSARAGFKEGNPTEVLVAFERFVYLNIIPGLIGGLIKGGLPDDDDDDETWAGWLGVQALSSITQGIPIVGPAVTGVFSDFGYSGASPVGQGLDALIRAGSAERAQTITTNALNAIGAFTGLPASQLNRAVRTAFMVDNGEMEDSALAITRGVLIGPPKD